MSNDLKLYSMTSMVLLTVMSGVHSFSQYPFLIANRNQWTTIVLSIHLAGPVCRVRTHSLHKLDAFILFSHARGLINIKVLTFHLVTSMWWWVLNLREMHALRPVPPFINTLRQRQNGRHFADDIFKCIFFNENVWISIKISLKFVPKGPINNIPALVRIMAWRRTGDKPLSEPMMTQYNDAYMRPQWVNMV